MRNSLAASIVLLFGVVAFLATEEGRAAQRGRISAEGFISRGHAPGCRILLDRLPRGISRECGSGR